MSNPEKMTEKTSISDVSSDPKPITGDVNVLSYGDRRGSATEFLRDHNQSAATPIDPAAERRLVWKFDTRILPILAIMYFWNSLDKSNLGNAKTAGLVKDLKLVGTEYNTLLSIFYVPYVLTAPVLAILGKKYGPSRVLPCMMMTFGSMTILVVATTNFGGLVALR